MTRWGAAAVAAMIVMAGPVPAQAQEQADPVVAEARRFLDLMQAGSWAEAAKLISPAMPAQLQGADRLEALWGQLRASVGELQSLELYRVQPADTLRSVEFIATFPGQRLLLRVVMSPARQVSGFWAAPAPAPAATPGSGPPYADSTRFREETVELGVPGWRLGGTVSTPVAAGRHPAIVLVHGSGPHDRDETVGPNKVFRDLAHGLASQGIVVLRYDKRTLTHGARMPAPTVEAEVIEDALLALELVRARPDVDPARVYLLGHSLGGQVAPEIARRDGRLAGLVLFAAPARAPAELILDQLTHLGTLPQNQPPAAQQQLATMRAQITSLHDAATPDTANVLGAPASYWRDLARYDAVATAKTLRLPMLVLQAERDYQVTMKDFTLWQAALADRPDATLRAIPSLNHMFIAGEGTPNPIEYTKPGFVAVEAVQAIKDFIR